MFSEDMYTATDTKPRLSDEVPYIDDERCKHCGASDHVAGDVETYCAPAVREYEDAGKAILAVLKELA